MKFLQLDHVNCVLVRRTRSVCPLKIVLTSSLTFEFTFPVLALAEILLRV